jgi:hypothetical protein
LAAVAAWQNPVHAEFAQTPSTQNNPAEQLLLSTPHFFPWAHLLAQVPPQSTSVSSPFLMLSLHVVCCSDWHTFEQPSPLSELPSSHCSPAWM